MLNPRFKTLCLLSSFIGYEQGKTIVEKYEQKLLFPMLLKCHYNLHPLAKSRRGIVDQGVEKDNNLDIFEVITNASELVLELINKKLLIFKCYQVDVKDFKYPLQWWEKHENMFHIISFCVKQILIIVGSKLRQRRYFL
jgi:hypothetical protein